MLSSGASLGRLRRAGDLELRDFRGDEARTMGRAFSSFRESARGSGELELVLLHE